MTRMLATWRWLYQLEFISANGVGQLPGRHSFISARALAPRTAGLSQATAWWRAYERLAGIAARCSGCCDLRACRDRRPA
eukprot:351462-Chlamydomonas_euryale.AAC.7